MEINPSPPIQNHVPSDLSETEGLTREDRLKLVFLGFIAILVLAAIVVGAILLFKQEPYQTSHIRDIFIIFIALEALVIGLALVILMVQIATLINLLQNEIKPVLKATNETANTLRGTAAFLSNNIVEPVMKLNEYLAAIKRLADLVRPKRN
jgi:hypothetical protein